MKIHQKSRQQSRHRNAKRRRSQQQQQQQQRRRRRRRRRRKVIIMTMKTQQKIRRKRRKILMMKWYWKKKWKKIKQGKRRRKKANLSLILRRINENRIRSWWKLFVSILEKDMERSCAILWVRRTMWEMRKQPWRVSNFCSALSFVCLLRQKVDNFLRCAMGRFGHSRCLDWHTSPHSGYRISHPSHKIG